MRSNGIAPMPPISDRASRRSGGVKWWGVGWDRTGDKENFEMHLKTGSREETTVKVERKRLKEV